MIEETRENVLNIVENWKIVQSDSNGKSTYLCWGCNIEKTQSTVCLNCGYDPGENIFRGMNGVRPPAKESRPLMYCRGYKKQTFLRDNIVACPSETVIKLGSGQCKQCQHLSTDTIKSMDILAKRARIQSILTKFVSTSLVVAILSLVAYFYIASTSITGVRREALDYAYQDAKLKLQGSTCIGYENPKVTAIGNNQFDVNMTLNCIIDETGFTVDYRYHTIVEKIGKVWVNIKSEATL